MSLQEANSLDRAFSELKSKNKDVRAKASYELLNHVILAHSGMTVNLHLIVFGG